MEGDPLINGGLEYLFGFIYEENGQAVFKPFWGHTRSEEKSAFEAAMDFIAARLKAFPEAHIYHYAAYEETAIKRLAMPHGTREVGGRQSLRGAASSSIFIEWFARVIRVSEPSYSIKNLEVFYHAAARRRGEHRGRERGDV